MSKWPKFDFWSKFKDIILPQIRKFTIWAWRCLCVLRGKRKINKNNKPPNYTVFISLSIFCLNTLTKIGNGDENRNTNLALLNKVLNWLFSSGAKFHKLKDSEVMGHLNRTQTQGSGSTESALLHSAWVKAATLLTTPWDSPIRGQVSVIYLLTWTVVCPLLKGKVKYFFCNNLSI